MLSILPLRDVAMVWYWYLITSLKEQFEVQRCLMERPTSLWDGTLSGYFCGKLLPTLT